MKQQFDAWEQLARETIYDSPHLRVHLDTIKLPSGTVIDDYSVVEFNDVVMCVITDTKGDVLMQREYRYAVNKTMWSLPAGSFRRGSEKPTDAAIREIEEETGYLVDKVNEVAQVHDYATKAPHVVYVMRAVDAKKGGVTHHEDTEQIKVEVMSQEKVKELVFSNQIESSSVISALVLGLPELFGKH